MSLRPIVMLWIEGQLGPIERLSLASFRAQGHAVTLYAYGQITGVPKGVSLRDGREVLPEAVARANRYPSGSYALFANLFRCVAIQKGLGLWCDTDVICLRPIDLPTNEIFGWESKNYVNNAILLLRPDCPILIDIISAFLNKMAPNWVPIYRAPLVHIKQYLGFNIHSSELPRATFGPKGLTALARLHKLLHLAKPREVFYPLPPREARRIFDADCRLEDYVAPDTLTIHLWNEKLKDLKHLSPPSGSLLRELYERYGV